MYVIKVVLVQKIQKSKNQKIQSKVATKCTKNLFGFPSSVLYNIRQLRFSVKPVNGYVTLVFHMKACVK